MLKLHMEKYTKIIDAFRDSINQKMKELISKDEIESKFKDDNSIVTKMDLFISDLCKSLFQKDFPELGFFSEEDQKEGLKFPTIILDPIDGTKEFAQQIPECAVSLAIMNSSDIADPLNFAWIFNPYSKFEISTIDDNLEDVVRARENKICMVSRTEFAHGLHDETEYYPDKVIAVGSIAYKLGLLAVGECDYVISKKPKHIWDIAAGVIILNRLNYKFFSNSKVVNELSDLLYKNNLKWDKPQANL